MSNRFVRGNSFYFGKGQDPFFNARNALFYKKTILFFIPHIQLWEPLVELIITLYDSFIFELSHQIHDLNKIKNLPYNRNSIINKVH